MGDARTIFPISQPDTHPEKHETTLCKRLLFLPFFFLLSFFSACWSSLSFFKARGMIALASSAAQHFGQEVGLSTCLHLGGEGLYERNRNSLILLSDQSQISKYSLPIKYKFMMRLILHQFDLILSCSENGIIKWVRIPHHTFEPGSFAIVIFTCPSL